MVLRRGCMKRKEKKMVVPLLVICILSIILVIVHFINRDNGFNSLKDDKRANVVLDVFEGGNTHVPMINLKSTAAQAINDQIFTKASTFLEQGNNIITYDYDITGKILSLAVQYINTQPQYPVITYDVYHINVYTSDIYSDEDILDQFGIDQEAVVPIVEARFKEFYVDLYNEHYFDDECSYECFLYMRGIKNHNYMEDSHYYIRKGNLYVLKPFQMYSPFHEEKYFTFEDFLIQITE